MNNPDLMDALQALAADKGISVDTLFGALADAFESAYKRLPDSYEYAWVVIDPDTGEFRVMAQELDEDGDPRRSRARRHPAARGVGPRRRADHEAGHEPAHPRGRAGDEVRGVRGARGRHRHRHHPADRRPLHAARPGPGRGPAAAGRAGALRAARARRRGSRPTSSRSARPPRAPRSWSAAPIRASSSASSSSRSPRSPTASSRSRPAPASPVPAPRSPSGPTTPTSTPSGPASAPGAPACAWSSTSSGARRSTSSPSPTTPPTSS